ncbi:hypothetical protein VFSR5_0920 [Aliivibrio fischeri SR5]|uniref:ABC transporter permease n=1 Tax=Aliivibrio fischeri SR5 TaxID=1088719 RepID=A0AAV3EW92_ALIFS|nr:hypothetical protein VFSR5_0920 [Aliivibrio fischeri SR5]
MVFTKKMELSSLFLNYWKKRQSEFMFIIPLLFLDIFKKPVISLILAL